MDGQGVNKRLKSWLSPVVLQCFHSVGKFSVRAFNMRQTIIDSLCRAITTTSNTNLSEIPDPSTTEFEMVLCVVRPPVLRMVIKSLDQNSKVRLRLASTTSSLVVSLTALQTIHMY